MMEDPAKAGARGRGIRALIPTKRRTRLVVYPLAGVVVVLVAAQLALPPIATSVIRGRLGKGARITSIKVSSFPAIELLWEHVGSLDLVMSRYDTSVEHLFGQIKQSGEVSTLNVSIGTLSAGPLTLHDVDVHKRDGELTLGARLYTSDLRNALPIIQSVTPIQSSDGSLTLRGTASLLGQSVSVNAIVAAQDGKVVVAPQGLLGAFATVTVFNNPNLFVQDVSGRAIPGGLQISARATYR